MGSCKDSHTKRSKENSYNPGGKPQERYEAITNSRKNKRLYKKDCQHRISGAYAKYHNYIIIIIKEMRALKIA